MDFESYYDKECSIKTLGPLGYFSHPQFDAYMVSVVGDNGYAFVGSPKDFDWSLLAGEVVLSHNASFDETLYLYGVSQRWWAEVQPKAWHCTADMAAACGYGRSLQAAAAQILDLEITKDTRNNMAGKRWEDMTDEFQKEVSDYALKDSELCLKIWQECSDKWTERERDISLLNRRIVQRGIPMNVDLLKQQNEELSQRLFEAESAIPWAGEQPLLSRKAFDEECRKHGIEPPKSLSAADVDATDWLRRHGTKHRWIESVTSWRRINALKKKVEAFDYATMADDRYYGGLMYYGSHTGRFSGSGGNLNLQNLPRNEMFGVNLRHLITAPEGKRLVVVDLSQIEVRTLCWLAGDHETLKLIKECDDFYTAFAIKFGLWSPEQGSLKDKDPALRHRVKAMVLGCGYGCGAPKFAMISGMPEKEAVEAVQLYRSALKKVPALWREYSTAVQTSYDLGVPFVIDLPSGRSLNYGKLKMSEYNGRMQHVGIINRFGKRTPMKLWGGIIAENCSQALARDIFCDSMLRIDAAGIKIILHVHDEVVIECPAEEAEQVLDTTRAIMSTPPEWISDIPLAAEGEILTHYQK